MRRVMLPAALALLALTPSHALAQGPVQAETSSVAAPVPIDPARLAAAKLVVGHLFPVGTYRTMMGDTMSKMMESMMDRMMDIPIADFAKMASIPADKLATMNKVTTAQIMEITDPYFRERSRRTMSAMMESMGDLMETMEPRVRDGLTRAYARRFDVTQLGEMNAFFSTPTGSLYASQSMMLFMDPEIMSEMQNMFPEIMKQMPKIIAAAQKATADLPKPRKYSDLSKAEKDKVAALMGETPR